MEGWRDGVPRVGGWCIPGCGRVWYTQVVYTRVWYTRVYTQVVYTRYMPPYASWASLRLILPVIPGYSCYSWVYPYSRLFLLFPVIPGLFSRVIPVIPGLFPGSTLQGPEPPFNI